MAVELMERPTTEEIEASTLFDRVSVRDMFVDPSYGRRLDPNAVDKLLREWDERALGTLMLSLRPDGRYAIIDGQHRRAGAKRMGLSESVGYAPARSSNLSPKVLWQGK